MHERRWTGSKKTEELQRLAIIFYERCRRDVGNGEDLGGNRVKIVAAWVYDGIISSGVNRWGRDVHCIVGVLGKSSHTL